MMPAIEIHSLRKARGSQGIAIDYLCIPAGQIVGLFGDNGAGKTTLLKILAGSLVPDAGQIHLQGFDLASQRADALQQVVAVVQGEGPLGPSDASEPAVITDGQSENLLPGLDGWATSGLPWEELSHGFQRQAALARALRADCPILLLDEPMWGLDTQAAAAVEAHLRLQVRQQNRTALIASCQPSLMLAGCDRVIVIQAGRIVTDNLVSPFFGLAQPGTYHIRVKGTLDSIWESWLGGMRISTVGDEATICGLVADQPALYGLLIKLQNMGLTLLSLERVHPELENLAHSVVGPKVPE